MLSALLVACGPESDPAGTADAEQSITVDPQPSALRLELDRVVYDATGSVAISLDVAQLALRATVLEVAVAAPSTDDVERVELLRGADGRFSSRQLLPLSTGPATPGDGLLSVREGDTFYAFHAVDRSEPGLAGSSSDLLSDVGLVLGGPAAPVRVEPLAALTLDETELAESPRPLGSLLVRGAPPVQVATHELIVYPRDASELERFLQRTSGTVLGEQPVDSVSAGPGAARAVLVAFQPPPATPETLARLRELFGLQQELVASRPELLGLLAAALEARAEGFIVSLNPRLAPAAAPALAAGESIGSPMRMVPRRGFAGPCIPGDPDAPCIFNVPALWAFTALWEGDEPERRVEVAVLDTGFAPNADFRLPESGVLHQCNMSSDFPAPGWFARGGFPCGPGAAERPGSAGGPWHGNGAVTTLGGVLNDAHGSAGVAGLSAVPMLYGNNVVSFGFEMGAGIRQAVEDGAAAINISAGYPCAAVTDFGPIEYCTAGDRAAACGVLTAALAEAALSTCAKTGWIPFFGAFSCTKATLAASAASGACITSLGYGDIDGPMTSAVRFAAQAGVPVVASAGNRVEASMLPPGVRELVDLSNQRLESWRVVPASLPEVIAVGAVDGNSASATFLDNQHFYGKRVDIWAPMGSHYVQPGDARNSAAPPVVSAFFGTSAAAPFITGVIASMQAVNPQLNRRNPDLSPEARGRIVTRVRELLTRTAFTNEELAAWGYANQWEERRLLVNPLAAVTAAAALRYPFLADYDSSVNFSELKPGEAADTPSNAKRLSPHTAEDGTIVSLPTTGAAFALAPDVDWYAFTMPGAPGTLQTATVDLTYPRPGGRLLLTGANVAWPTRSTGPNEAVTEHHRILAAAGAEVRVRVEGPSGNDNVYRIELGDATPVLPRLSIAAPIAGASVCDTSSVALSALVSFDGFDGLDAASREAVASVAGGAIQWFDGGVLLGAGQELSHVFEPGEHALSVRAYGSDTTLDRVTLTVQDCVGFAPEVRIVVPSASFAYSLGEDCQSGRCYVDIPVVAEAVDEEDGVLSGSAVIWSTDRTDLQSEIVGTGSSTTLRFYEDDPCGDSPGHTLRVEAVDSQGNRSEPDTVNIIIGTLC